MYDSVTLWTVACQVPLSLEFSRQEYWSGLPFTSPGDLQNPGIEPWSPTLQADLLPPMPTGLLIFLPTILIPTRASSPAFLMMYSAYKLNKQGDNIQP